MSPSKAFFTSPTPIPNEVLCQTQCQPLLSTTLALKLLGLYSLVEDAEMYRTYREKTNTCFQTGKYKLNS